MNVRRLASLVPVVLLSIALWAGSALAGPGKVYVADEEGDAVYATPDSRLLFVANQGSKKAPGRTVSVIDFARLEVVKTLETGPGAHGVVVATDGRYAFVTNTYGNTVSVIEVAGLKVVATVPVGKGPNGVSVTP